VGFILSKNLLLEKKKNGSEEGTEKNILIDTHALCFLDSLYELYNSIDTNIFLAFVVERENEEIVDVVVVVVPQISYMEVSKRKRKTIIRWRRRKKSLSVAAAAESRTFPIGFSLMLGSRLEDHFPGTSTAQQSKAKQTKNVY